MADPTPSPSPVAPSPALSSTADTTPYVSVSWMAVAGAAAAALFLFMLLLFGYAAFKERKPLILNELLILPVITIVFCFAARKIIQNSEGTRTGILFNVDLVKNAWWVALVGGLGYTAYLFAIDYSIRRDAVNEAEKFVAYVLKGDEESINRGLIQTQLPGRRGDLDATRTKSLIDPMRDSYITFVQSDLVQLAKRNPDGACQFTAGGVKDWVYQPGLIRCVLVGTVRCPEGIFPIQVELRGLEAPVNSEMVGRQWAVFFKPDQTKFVLQDRVARTPYGWRMVELEELGAKYGRGFIEGSSKGKVLKAVFYHSELVPNPTLIDRASLLARLRGVLGFDPSVFLLYSPEYPTYIRDKFFRNERGEDLTVHQRETCLQTWMDSGLLLPGGRIQKNNTLDIHSTLTITDTAVEVRVPCEIPLASGAARGRLVVACTDPKVLAEIKQLRAEANPDQTIPLPPDIGNHPFAWRVIRVETDLFEVRPQQEGPPDPGQGP